MMVGVRASRRLAVLVLGFVLLLPVAILRDADRRDARRLALTTREAALAEARILAASPEEPSERDRATDDPAGASSALRETLAALERRSGIRVRAVEPLPDSVAPPLRLVGHAVRLAGPYHAVLAFVRELEALPDPVEAGSLFLDAVPDSLTAPLAPTPSVDAMGDSPFTAVVRLVVRRALPAQVP